MPNPFYYGGHVSPDQFVGRRAELQRIFAALEIAHTDQLQSVSVVGPRRIGKSSLLFYLTNCYANFLKQPANYRVAYIDLQDADCKTRDGLLRAILKGLQVTPPPSGPLTLPRFQQAILKLESSRIYPVVCLDEFEELFENTEEFTTDLYDSWRHLINENAAAFVTASKSTLNELAATKQYTSPFFNIFTLLPLGKLTDDEAQELADRGYSCDRPFSRAERDLVAQMGDNHPYKIQLAGSLVYQANVNGGEADRDWVRREFQRQLEAVGLAEPTVTKAVAKGSQRALLWFIPALGRFVLEMIFRKKKGEYSESNEWLAGVFAIVIVIALALGLIPLSLVLNR